LKLTALLDNSRSEICYQIALAIKDEVEDLEAGGINVRFVGDLSIANLLLLDCLLKYMLYLSD
jgi:methionine synthase II (cobalamin-independent)